MLDKIPFRNIQPPAVQVPNVDPNFVYKIIAAIILMMVGLAFWKTTIGKVIIVGVIVYLVLKVSGHVK